MWILYNTVRLTEFPSYHMRSNGGGSSDCDNDNNVLEVGKSVDLVFLTPFTYDVTLSIFV